MVCASQILFSLAERQTMQETIRKPQEDKLFQLGKRKQDPGFELAAGRTWRGLGRVALKGALGWWEGMATGAGGGGVAFTGRENPLADACARVRNEDWRERQGRLGSCPG